MIIEKIVGILALLLFWIIFPVGIIVAKVTKKDFNLKSDLKIYWEMYWVVVFNYILGE